MDDLSFSVEPGEIYGFLGRNGAGKSTSIRMILGLVWPTRGSIQVAGYPVRTGRHPHPWPVGSIVESPVFYQHLTARKNLELLSSLSGGASDARIDEVIERVGLSDRCDELVSVYSHGMRQRLGLAQALLPDPELIVLDEPLDGLDPNGIREMRDVMTSVVAEGRVTIVYSSHILSEVELTCDRVLVINEGRKLYEGAISEMDHHAPSVRLRTAPGENPREALSALSYVANLEEDEGTWTMDAGHEKVPELNRALVQADLSVLELSPIKRNLEDIFIELTVSPPANYGEDR